MSEYMPYAMKKITKEKVVKQIMCFSFAFLIKNCVSVFYYYGSLRAERNEEKRVGNGEQLQVQF